MSLLKKVVKEEMNEKEKKYFGKKKRDGSGKKTTITTVKGLKVALKVKVDAKTQKRKQ